MDKGKTMTEKDNLMYLIEEAEELFPSQVEAIADHLIANGVTVQEWISVKDKLPDFFGTFLVVVEEDDQDNTLYTDCADYDPFEKSWRTFGYFNNGSRIKLWMHLPQPPKGE